MFIRVSQYSKEMPNSSREDASSTGLLALRQTRAIAEAARFSELLQNLVRRAGIGDEVDVATVVSQLLHLEQSHLMRVTGPIPGRNHFKRRAGSGNPNRDQRPLRLFFADESGVPRLTASEGENGCFALGTIAITEGEKENYRVRADRLKRDFGLPEVVLHEPEMSRRLGDFYFRGDVQKQQEFDRAVDQLIDDTEFTAFAVAVRKQVFGREFLATGKDPFLPVDFYELAVHLLLERVVDFLAANTEYPLGRLTFEARGPREDVEVQLCVAETLRYGTRWVSNRAFQRYLEPGVSFRPKRGSHPLEISDMLARSVYDWVISGCTQEAERWRLFGRKWYGRDDLRMGKFGLKVFPDSDLSERIEAHRDRFRAK